MALKGFYSGMIDHSSFSEQYGQSDFIKFSTITTGPQVSPVKKPADPKPKTATK